MARWRCAGARRRLRSGAEPPRGDQDLSRRPEPHAGQPSRAALGAGARLRASALQDARPREPDRGAGLFRCRFASRVGVDREAQRRLAARLVRVAVRALRRVRGQRGRASRSARRGAARAAVPAWQLSQRPARAGGRRLSRRARRPRLAGSGADRDRQDRRHAVPDAARLRRRLSRPRAVPDRQDAGARAGARCAGLAARRARGRGGGLSWRWRLRVGGCIEG